MFAQLDKELRFATKEMVVRGCCYGGRPVLEELKQWGETNAKTIANY
jgi:hypothetical protein